MITSIYTGMVRVLIHKDSTPVQVGEVVARLDDPTELRRVLGESEVAHGYLEAYKVDENNELIGRSRGNGVGYTLLPPDYGLEWREL